MSESTISQTQALRPVVYELGAAIYLCQQFETNLLFLVSILTANEEGVVTSKSFKDELVALSEAKKTKKTLGQLAVVFKSKLSLPDNFEAYIRQGVEARNNIVHGFVMRNTKKFLSSDGRTEIIDELREAQHVINERFVSLNEVLDRALQVFGGSLEQLRQEADFRFEPDVIDELTRH
jgi:hypothetical protein